MKLSLSLFSLLIGTLGIISRNINTAEGTPDFGHALFKRQSDNTEEEQRCMKVLHGRICSSGYSLDYATVAQQCNFTTVATSVLNDCRVNSRGDLCGPLRVESGTVRDVCGSSPLTCSRECFELLTRIRIEQGCCVNVFNNSASNSFDEDTFANSIWSLCEVEPVAEECAPSLFDLSEASIDPTCNGDAIVLHERLISEVFCRQDYFGEVVSDLTEAGCEGTSILDGANQICSANENGQYCLFQHEIASLDNTAMRLCDGTTGRCDPACIEALNNATSALGCCFINLANGTFTTTTPREWLSYSFWQQCGLISPGFCELRLIPVAATTTNTARDSNEVLTERSKATLAGASAISTSLLAAFVLLIHLSVVN